MSDSDSEPHIDIETQAIKGRSDSLGHLDQLHRSVTRLEALVRHQRQQDQRSATGLGSRYSVLHSWVGVACETYGGQHKCFVGCVGCVNPCHNRVAGLYRPISDSSRSAMPASRVYILPIRAGHSRSTGGHGSGALPCSVGCEPARAPALCVAHTHLPGVYKGCRVSIDRTRRIRRCPGMGSCPTASHAPSIDESERRDAGTRPNRRRRASARPRSIMAKCRWGNVDPQNRRHAEAHVARRNASRTTARRNASRRRLACGPRETGRSARGYAFADADGIDAYGTGR